MIADCPEMWSEIVQSKIKDCPEKWSLIVWRSGQKLSRERLEIFLDCQKKCLENLPSNLRDCPEKREQIVKKLKKNVRD